METPQTIYQFKPQPDITAYELAQVMPVLILDKTARFYNARPHIAKMPPEVKRHFREIPAPPPPPRPWLEQVLEALFGWSEKIADKLKHKANH